VDTNQTVIGMRTRDHHQQKKRRRREIICKGEKDGTVLKRVHNIKKKKASGKFKKSQRRGKSALKGVPERGECPDGGGELPQWRPRGVRNGTGGVERLTKLGRLPEEKEPWDWEILASST